MKKWAEKMTAWLIGNHIIAQDDKELVEFGIQQGFSLFLNICSTILMGILMGMVWESIGFLILYTPLRCYAGGFHAKTRIRCYLLSLIIIGAALFFIRYVVDNGVFSTLVFIISGLVLWLAAPVESKSKPLSDTENMVYRKRTRYVLAIQSILFLCLMLTRWNHMAVIVCAAVLTASCMVVIQLINTSQAA